MSEKYPKVGNITQSLHFLNKYWPRIVKVIKSEPEFWQ
jgi:hypothetical protein